VISSELPELVALSTRISCWCDGRLVGELARAEADPESLLRMMAGLDPAAAAARLIETSYPQRGFPEVSGPFRDRFARKTPQVQRSFTADHGRYVPSLL
jgi:hypothetical protein